MGRLSTILSTLWSQAAGPGGSGSVLAANKTTITFDGEEIHGLKGFTYKVYLDRQDVRAISKHERIGVVYGREHVKGKILVHSNNEKLNGYMKNRASFQIMVMTMQDSYPQKLGQKKMTFDGCHIDDREFQLDAHGYGLTTYTFTADRVREE